MQLNIHTHTYMKLHSQKKKGEAGGLTGGTCVGGDPKKKDVLFPITSTRRGG